VPVADLALALWPGDGREGGRAFDITAARLRRLLGGATRRARARPARALNAHCVWLTWRLAPEARAGEAATDDSAALAPRSMRRWRSTAARAWPTGASPGPTRRALGFGRAWRLRCCWH